MEWYKLNNSENKKYRDRTYTLILLEQNNPQHI